MNVLITDYQYADIENEKRIIGNAGFTLTARAASNKKDLLALVQTADAIITQYCNIDADIIALAKQCKVIIKYGIGINNIDADAAGKAGIYVCNIPDYSIDEVSNHAICMTLTLSKKLNVLASSLKSGTWSYLSAVPVHRMAGSVLGLVGFGRIPQAVARKMHGFDVSVIAYDPYCGDEFMKEKSVKKVDFDTLLEKADIISLHCPYNKETHHMFCMDTFHKMKNSAIIINTSRGSVIDEQALIDALQNGFIAGAGLDVFEKEPLDSSSPLLSMPNVIATPHSAWYSEEAITSLQISAAEEAVRVLQGMPPKNPCNLAVLEKNGFIAL